MEMPKPGDEHRRLAKLDGSWRGEERMLPTPWKPEGGKALGRMSARLSLGGFYLIMSYEQEQNGRLAFEGHGVLGWDPRGRCYTMHWFDSSGIEHGAPAIGSWDGNVLTLTHETHLGHSRQVYEVGDGEYRFRLDNSADGRKWSTFLEGTYRRTD